MKRARLSGPFFIYPFPDLTAGIGGFGALGAAGLGVGETGLGATLVEGLGVVDVFGLEIDGLEGFGSLGADSFEPPRLIAGLIDSVGLEIELSLLSALGLSTVVFGLPIVSGRFGGYLPSAKVCALLLRAGRSTLLRTVVVGAGIFGVGGTFGAIFR
jgi:hypothetical protein